MRWKAYRPVERIIIHNNEEDLGCLLPRGNCIEATCQPDTFGRLTRLTKFNLEILTPWPCPLFSHLKRRR